MPARTSAASKVRGMTPWARQAMKGLDLETLGRGVPDGYFISFGAGRKPDVWRVFLVRDAAELRDRRTVARMDEIRTAELGWAIQRLAEKVAA